MQPALPLILLLLQLLVSLPAQGSQAPVWDVPIRGAHAYQRQRSELLVLPPTPPPGIDWVIQSGEDISPHKWRYLATEAAPTGYQEVGFDDAQWPTGAGEFGPNATGKEGSPQRTQWSTTLLCLRTQLDLGSKKPRALWFEVDHDDHLRIWLNGQQVVADNGHGQKRWYFVTGQGLSAWQRGINTIAVQCLNIGGYQMLDVRCALVHQLPPGAKTTNDLPDALRAGGANSERVRGDLFGAFRPPALLLDGELDAERRMLRISPGDLRDVATWVALDLRSAGGAGNVQAEIGPMFRLGDLLVRGRAGPVAADGWQQVEVTLKSPPELLLRGETKRVIEQHVRPHVIYSCDARLTLRRRLQKSAAGTKVVEFETALEGQLLRGKEVAARLQQQEQCVLQTTYEGQDGAFRAAVAKALQRGTSRLREHLQDPAAADLGPEAPDSDRTYQTGRLALGLLALVKGGIATSDEVVQKGFAALRPRRIYDTYSLANAMLALDALYTPAAEVGAFKSGELTQPLPRAPSPEDRALMQRWCDQLLTNVDARVDADRLLRFHYTPSDGFDNSVTQYGMLGLHAARLAGIELPVTVWEAAIQHWLACQANSGPKAELELLDFRSLARRSSNPEAPFTTSSIVANRNGWNYHEIHDDGAAVPARGSMTCAAITSLAIAQAGLQSHPTGRRSKLLAEAQRARNDGFAWLAQHMTARYHPGQLMVQQHWIYYYLYSLERASLLSNVAWIQGRDWYLEGALVLILTQDEKGDWPGELQPEERAIERDAMAILFLAQSSRPVVTGR